MDALKLIIPVVLAIGGWWFTLWREREKRNLDTSIARVDAQIEKLWGPLYAGAIANERAWRTINQRWANQFEIELEKDEDYLNDPQKRKLWIGYNREVFQPANQRMANAIFEHTHLFEVDNHLEMPAEVIEFIEHVESWRVVVSQWKEEDFDATDAGQYELESISEWDKNFNEFVRANYEGVIHRKTDLLNKASDWRFLSWMSVAPPIDGYKKAKVRSAASRIERDDPGER